MIAAWQKPVSRRRFLGALGALTLGTAALAACGTTATATTGATSGGAGGEVSNGTYGGTKFSGAVVAQKVDVAAVQGALKWDKAQYTATAGDVTFAVKNPGPMQHQFGIEGNGLMYESGNLDPNTTTNLTITGLKAGTYDLVCNFPGHKAGGWWRSSPSPERGESGGGADAHRPVPPSPRRDGLPHRPPAGVRMIAMKRVYAPAVETDGYRVLAERLRPRGLSTIKARLDAWEKALAPSNDLRHWYGHDPEKWVEFQSRYARELATPAAQALLDQLAARARQGPVTLVYASHAGAISNTARLRQNSDKGWQEQLCYGSVTALAVV